MGKCVSKHPSALTIALSEKDLAAANQIWSKFAASTEYVALKDEHGNQLCEYYYVSNKDDIRQQEQQQQQQPTEKQQSQQQQQGNQQRKQKKEHKENKSGQWTTEKIEYDDDDEDEDDDRAIVAQHVAAAADDDDDDAAGVRNVLHVVNITNNGLDDEQHYFTHCQWLQHQEKHHEQLHHPEYIPVPAADTNNNASINVAGVKHNINNKNKQQKAAKRPKKKKKKNSNLSMCLGVQRNNSRRSNEFGEDSDGHFYCPNEDNGYSEGQSESKKSSKKQATIGGGGGSGMETKGTSMSFGFRKKLNTTPKKLKKLIEGDFKKKQDKCNNLSEGGGGAGDGVDGVGGRTGTVIDTELREDTNDDNGNAEPLTKILFEKVGAAAVGNASTQKTLKNQGVSEQLNRIGTGNRFGYRGCNTVRPASTGITARHQSDARDNLQNNNCSGGEGGPNGGLVSNLKRRSKSAHADRALTSDQFEQESDGNGAAPPKITQPKTITFNLNQNSTIEYQRQQFFQQPTGGISGRAVNIGVPQHRHLQQQHQSIVNTGMHTNVIVRPTPRAAPVTYSKFTLQTVSLPKPEFPVAISVCATTPTTPGSIFSPSPTSATGAGAGTRTVFHVQQQQHPLTAATQPQHMDLKTAKQMANNTRRGFSGSREISADSGISSMDVALDSSTSSGGGGGRCASPKRSRSRPRNLQMVLSGRHKFEVRDLDDPLSSESSSLVEPLALPKLPAENQTMPLPLSGLVRSNTVLSREAFERKNTEVKQVQVVKPQTTTTRPEILRNPSEESESVDEEKLYLDRSTSEKSAKHQQQFRDINTCSSKTSSPGSSIMSSWCNAAGESLAIKDCSSLSISSSEDSNKLQDKLKDLTVEFYDDDLITDMQVSTISSITENNASNDNQTLNTADEEDLNHPHLPDNLTKCDSFGNMKQERPKSLYNTLNESKFAEMALAGSAYLLDDETSPTDSLVSSTESEEAGCKQKKHKLNEELQEKDIDEISPELEVCSPISPGTPTHASHSLSLSDCGNLIDDEIADQPALLFNTEAMDGLESAGASHKDKTDTPTLMETCSMRSLKSQSKARSALQQAIELSLRTPMSLRKAVMERAESLDTLSPCESICSDDLMMDFDVNSSMDSIDRSLSIKSRSGSDLNKIDEAELFSELERKGSNVMKELNTILRVHTTRNTEKDSVIAHLPARATRLLNRSRLQQQCPLNNADSDSSKSAHSVRRSGAASRASSASTSNASVQRNQYLHHRESHSSSDDLMLYDKSFRNAMIQDVLQFKKQLLRLRRILQETETLNPFENDNGQLFASCGLDSKLLDDIDLASLTSSITDDPMQELADLRRQVVYLQGQVDDRDRTIRLQRNLIEKLEAEKSAPTQTATAAARSEAAKECINMATQTERTRPLSIGPDGLSRSKPEYTSYTTHFPALCSDSTTIIQHQQQYPGQHNNTASNQTRRHTIISTTLTNYNHQLAAHAPRRASIAWEPHQTPAAAYKPVRITLIGEPLKQWHGNGNGECQNLNGKGTHIEVTEYNNNKNHLLNGSTDLLNAKMKKLNGLGEALHMGNGIKQAYQQLESFASNSPQLKHQQQKLPQTHFYQPHHHTNGNLNPTVTIV